MSKTIFLGISLALAAYAMNLAYDALSLKNASATLVGSNVASRLPIKLGWSAPETRNRVTFTPAMPLLILALVAVPMALGSATLHHLRTT